MIDLNKQVIFRKKSSGVGVLLLDCPGKVNQLTDSVMDELADTIDKLSAMKDLKALMIASGKSNTFISGADLNQIVKFKNSSEAYRMSKQGQKILSRLSNLGIPIVVGINGSCLGGGLELALWCHYRIATSDPITVLGLPEVKLGLLPGLGGTQRLPRLISLKSALQTIISAETMTAQQAMEIGIVDEIVHPDHLLSSMEKACLELAEGSRDWKRVESHGRTLEPAEQKLLAMSERSLRIKTKGQYPSFQSALSVVKAGLEQGIEVGLENEARAFGHLASSEIAKNLVFLYFAREIALRSAMAQASRTKGKVSRLGIVGGGTMGAAIGSLAAISEHEVLIKEADARRLEQALESIHARIVQQSGPSDKPPAPALKRVVPATDAGLAACDLVLEAVFEDQELKSCIHEELASKVNSDCVLASNTSSLSITEMAQHVPQSERFLGLHFFHPVDRMPLVEVILHPGTSNKALAAALSFVSRLGKVPVTVKDGPGFLVNRLLVPYLAEAGRLSEEGIPMNWIEESALSFGMPMGPLALMDEVGLDIAFTVADIVYRKCGERLHPPALMQKMKNMGLSGRKSASGFYVYDPSGKRGDFNPELAKHTTAITSLDKSDEITRETICRRLILPMVDEAARCLEEKIVRKARELDLAMVIGTGFPAFRGGPLHYADSLGLNCLVSQLVDIYSGHEPQRQVCNMLISMAESGKRFYGQSSEGE